MALFNCKQYCAEFLSAFQAVQISMKGNVSKDEVVKLRSILNELSTCLKIEKLILDFTESDTVFIDYNSNSRKEFWKTLENHGLQQLLLIIPPKHKAENSKLSNARYCGTEKYHFNVSVISDRKLLPIFVVKDSYKRKLK
jgi:hypothetical protein